MNSAYSQVQAADSSERRSLDSLPSDMSSGMTIVSESLPLESKTESSPMPLSLAISKHSLIQDVRSFTEGLRTSLQVDSPVSPSPSPGSKREPMTKGICGRQQQPSLELCAPDSFCLKTCQESVPTCPWLSETCADLGMKFQDPSSLGLTTLGRRTGGKGCGLLPTPCGNEGRNRKLPDGKRGWGLESLIKMWPTPQVFDANDCQKGPEAVLRDKNRRVMGGSGGPSKNLREVVSWATPSCRDWKSGKASQETMGRNARPMNEAVVSGGKRTLPTPSASMVTMQDMEQAKFAGSADRPKYADCPGGALNPEWVEWLMDVPLGFTDLKPLAICRFQAWLRQHGDS